MVIESVDILAILSGVTGLFFGVHSYLMTKANMVKTYFDADDSDEMRIARKDIYNNYNSSEKDLLNNISFAKVCSHYHFYGLMLKKHYIPSWVFKSANGSAIIRCYEKAIHYIWLRRKEDPYYAEYFEWLYSWVITHKM